MSYLCSTDLIFDDPDYDIVRYEYEWFADGEAFRSVTHAGHADAIPHHTLLPGEVLECRVTPSDGILRGDTATTSSSRTLFLSPGFFTFSAALLKHTTQLPEKES